MQFLIQHNLVDPHQLKLVKQAVKNYPHEFVGVIPFEREITSDLPVKGTEYIPYGSTLFVSIGHQRGWRGLHFDKNVMTYSNAMKNSKDMLNGENVFTAKEACSFLSGNNEHWFMRPDADLKHFSGYVDHAPVLLDHLKSMIDSYERGEWGTYGLNPKTKIILATPKTIQAEWRWFIVGGKIISGSLYRAHGQLRKLREVDPDVIMEAQAMADEWLPYDCVVMDTALVNNRVKVIEFNCINSSGFYDNDISAVFKALWEYHA
jgi:hypothetical protein